MPKGVVAAEYTYRVDPKKIRKLRERYVPPMSQTQLGQILDVTSSLISKWERVREDGSLPIDMTISTVSRLAAALECEIVDLLTKYPVQP